jgi:hypothetical protein
MQAFAPFVIIARVHALEKGNTHFMPVALKLLAQTANQVHY